MPELDDSILSTFTKRNLNRVKNLVGQTFNGLTVYSYLGSRFESGHWRGYWLCRCDCEKFTIRMRPDSHTVGCGCTRITHGKSHTLAYRSWSDMMRRCFHPDSQSAHRYSERGITVCERWREFLNFLADVGERPNRSLTINRVDNDGNYSCGKCPQCVERGWPMNARWDDIFTQANNRSNNRVLTFKGESHTLSEWGAIIGINGMVLSNRLAKGWTVERVLSPFHGKATVVEYNGETRELREWAALTGIKPATLSARHKRGKRGADLFRPVIQTQPSK